MHRYLFLLTASIVLSGCFKSENALEKITRVGIDISEVRSFFAQGGLSNINTWYGLDVGQVGYQYDQDLNLVVGVFLNFNDEKRQDYNPLSHHEIMRTVSENRTVENITKGRHGEPYSYFTVDGHTAKIGPLILDKQLAIYDDKSVKGGIWRSKICFDVEAAEALVKKGKGQPCNEENGWLSYKLVSTQEG